MVGGQVAVGAARELPASMPITVEDGLTVAMVGPGFRATSREVRFFTVAVVVEAQVQAWELEREGLAEEEMAAELLLERMVSQTPVVVVVQAVIPT